MAETAVVGSLVCDRRSRWEAVALSFEKLGTRKRALWESSGSCGRENGLRSSNGSEGGHSEDGAG